METDLTFIEKWVSPYRKALLAFLVPFAGNLLAAGQENSHGGTVITSHEWTESYLMAFVAAAAVWGVSNVSREESEAKRQIVPEEADDE